MKKILSALTSAAIGLLVLTAVLGVAYLMTLALVNYVFIEEYREVATDMVFMRVALLIDYVLYGLALVVVGNKVKKEILEILNSFKLK